jgi:predicted amidophosphoribosyltransferase
MIFDNILLGSVFCIGCNRKGFVVCKECFKNLQNIMGRAEYSARKLIVKDANLPVFSACSYEKTNRKIINAWKNSSVEELSNYIEFIIEKLTLSIVPTLKDILNLLGIQKVVLTPIPSRLKSKLKKNYLTNNVIINAIEYVLIQNKINCVVDNLLFRDNFSGEQVGKGTLQRQQNRTGTTYVKKTAKYPVILIDDILTTGASLLDAEIALSKKSVRVLFAITVAKTPF